MFDREISSLPKSDVAVVLEERRWGQLIPNVTIAAQQRTNTENAVPNNPENSANIKYNVGVSHLNDTALRTVRDSFPSHGSP